MTIAKKAIVWGLFAAGGTLTAFIYPALILIFLLLATGHVPAGLQYDQIHAFMASWFGKTSLFALLFLALWHAAHRLRVVAHDFGVRKDALVAWVVYLAATVGSLLTIYYLTLIR